MANTANIKDPLQPFLTEYWAITDAADAFIKPLDPQDRTNHCPLGGIYRSATKDCLRWFSPGCGPGGGIVNQTTNRCRRRSSPQWHPHVNTTDPTLGTQICIAAGAGPSSHLVLQYNKPPIRCVGPIQQIIQAMQVNQANTDTIIPASIGGSISALLFLFFIVLFFSFRRYTRKPRTHTQHQSPLSQKPHTSTQFVAQPNPYTSSLTFYKLQPRSPTAVAITIPEQRNTFQPTPSRKSRRPHAHN